MQYINGDGFYIALLGLLPLKTILYSTALSHAKSIIFYKVVMLPSSHSIKKTLLKALPNITNIKKKHMAVFDTSSSVGFSLGLLPQLNPYYLLTISILY